MVDFFKIATRSPKRGVTEIYPKFIIRKSQDLMIRGGDFYAVWLEDKGLWSTDEDDLIDVIDNALTEYFKTYQDPYGNKVFCSYLRDAESGMIDVWHKYCWKQTRDNYYMLDEKLIFANDGTNKKDYASKRLNYPLEQGDISAYDKLISTLYSEEERHKLEWAIGAIVTGDSKTIQKFMVLYGSAGTGKSTILNIIQKLFDGYYSVFDAKALGANNNAFALESFKTNPLVAIQHDGDLSRIEDNTKLNSLVSHEEMTINEKFKATYTNRFKAFLILGTNRPVKITDAKSGLIRRLIDVTPTGNKIPAREYKQLVKQIDFELGAIAYHCREVYLKDPGRYDNYIPTMMLGATNDFYNFVEDSYFTFKKEDGVSLKQAWEMYKTYCDDAKIPYPNSQRIFREELRNYFEEFHDRHKLNGEEVRNYYTGFITNKFNQSLTDKPKEEEPSESTWLEFKETESIFDKECSDCFAQYATNDGVPMRNWNKVTTKLSELDTSKLHYVRIPEYHIVIDFDIPDENGNKNFEKNLEAASKFPATYAELSKSGAGIHLHYIYSGDVNTLSRVYAEHIEVKVFTGKSSLRRMLTKCNDLPIATISSGLPVKGDGKVINFDVVTNEQAIRTLISKNLNKEYHSSTKCSIDFIYKILTDAYNGGIKYDVTDMRNSVLGFGANSTNNADYCIKLINKMPFKSEEASDSVINNDQPIVFYDVEVFPNLFLVNWKIQGEDKKIVRMINPKPSEIENLLKFRLVGFNCRRYDNHILYACYMGYNNEQLYKLSQRIISGDRDAFFGEAYNISYTDIYDYAAKKQSLKKWEIQLGIHHQELGLPWDQPVPEERWVEVAEYCDNDVIATEATWDATQADFLAREILAEIAGGTVNDTTNSLTTKLIFGNNRKPQDQFNYRDMGEVSSEDIIPDGFDDYTRFNRDNKPVFPGYEFEYGKSKYRGENIGEGGYVYAEPGIYGNVALLDIASMHPSSTIAEELFGPVYTLRYKELKDARVYIKHEDWDSLNNILDGKLTKYVQRVISGELTSKQLSNALKIAINSVYGLTSAGFINPFRDPRNKDNIVAKRGALFMVNLKHEVQKRGFIVAHIKTDSIKIPDATPEIIQFVTDYGKMYGYDFEHEATYDRMCLVNDAVYIAKYNDGEHEFKLPTGEKIMTAWTATGTQFQVPYVFKTLFSKDDITFDDLCETKSVAKGTIYLDMNEDLPDMSDKEKELSKYETLLRKEDFKKYSRSDLENDIQTLTDIIAENHNYVFIGRVGQFCPIKPGCGGGVLYRESDGKYYAVTGTKGYRWLESEAVRELGKEYDINREYYDSLVNAAAENISFYGDFEWFVSDDPYIGPEYDKKGQPVYLDFGKQ